jgi:hypothetical protein
MNIFIYQRINKIDYFNFFIIVKIINLSVWPARLCSTLEQEVIDEFKKQGEDFNSVAVVYFGKCQK